MGGLQGVTMTGNGLSSIIPINPVTAWSAPMNFPPSWSLGIGVTVAPTSNLSYDVQVTFDPKPTANGNWNNHDTLSNQVNSGNGSVAFPITGIRLHVFNYVSGSVNLGVAIWP